MDRKKEIEYEGPGKRFLQKDQMRKKENRGRFRVLLSNLQLCLL
jgi:hypothetical protein